MGIVSDYLRDLIAKQVTEKRLVVWFDPERHYSDLASALTLPDTTIARYAGSFFQLRHDVAPLLEGEQPPRLVVYVPLAEDDTHDALIELTAAGVVLKPGQQPWQRNTRLSVIAKAALKDVLGVEHAQRIEKQANEGQLSLADLDRLGDHVSSPEAHGVIAVIFGTGIPDEVALKLLSGDTFDTEIAAKHAQPDLTALLGETYGIPLPPDEPLPTLRLRLARHLLCTELLASLHPPVPPQLATVNIATELAPREACLRLVRRWRQTRDLADSYADYANRVERELGLSSIPFDLAQLRDCETFAAIETALQTALETTLRDAPSTTLLDLIQQRKRDYWAQRLPDAYDRWTLSATAGNLLLCAAEIEAALQHATLSAAAILHAYTDGERPWCELDTLQRELEQQSRRFESIARHPTLEQLLTHARQRYMRVGDTLAVRYTHALVDAGFQLPGIQRQTEIYTRHVTEALRAGKTAYILVDALRYEMARIFVQSLGDWYDARLAVAAGTVPTITPIGMAALLPGAEEGVKVVPAPNGNLALHLRDTVLRDRDSRIKWLKEQVPSTAHRPTRVFATTLDALLTTQNAVKKNIEDADLILVTSQEIDAICELDNISLAHTVMDALLANLVRGVRRLSELHCKQIIVTADHGFLFSDELGSDMKIEPPGGHTCDLHRRVWIGRGGAASEAYLRAPLAAFDLDDTDLELATPWGFGAFKLPGGARAYFHGGLSPQEMAIPVVVITPTARAAALASSEGREIAWRLTLGSQKITSRVCSVQIAGQRVSLFDTALPPVRVEIRAGSDIISRLVAADYGYSEATGEIQPRFQDDDPLTIAPDTAILHIERDHLPPQRVSIHLLDATTGRELQRLDEIDLDILF
ncbi:MAG: hypothetical protein OJF49_001783 [Ktedonobacterales bacterium]|jgi:hypothetical protein|nr:MAG: hypothetical protein OJF49_001783 [Ktedonobacterales bacterium]